MKLKSVICALAVAAMAPLFANQTSTNICGWMKVTSDLTNTIVGVPWVEVNGAADAAVKVANLVKTDDLTKGDKLYFYQDGTWFAWTLGDKGWAADTTVTVSGVAVSEPAGDQAVARGQALILERQATAKPFYLYGQYSAAAVPAQTAAQGSTAKPAYTLMASPKVEAFDLNAGKITGAGADDTIVVPLNGGASTIYRLKDGVWGSDVKTTVELFGKKVTKLVFTPATALPAGTGFWYVSVGGEPTIAW